MRATAQVWAVLERKPQWSSLLLLLLQAFQQGGALVFKGKDLVWAYSDPGTAAHADLATVVQVATEGL